MDISLFCLYMINQSFNFKMEWQKKKEKRLTHIMPQCLFAGAVWAAVMFTSQLDSPFLGMLCVWLNFIFKSHTAYKL